jgi:hypothetical protein
MVHKVGFVNPRFNNLQPPPFDNEFHHQTLPSPIESCPPNTQTPHHP